MRSCAVVLLAAWAAADECTVTADDGTKLDLSEIPNVELSMPSDPYGETAVLASSWCRKGVTAPPAGMSSCDGYPFYFTKHLQSGFCDQMMPEWQQYDSVVKSANGGYDVTYSVGGVGGTITGKFTLKCDKSLGATEVICDPSVGGSECKLLRRDGDAGWGSYIYSTSFLTGATCPASSSSSSGGGCQAACAFLLIVFLGAFVYFTAGMAYNYKIKELRGIELVPNLTFWKELPHFVADGAKFAFQKTSEGVSRLRGQ